MSTSTVYDVKIKYSLDDKTSTGMKSIANSTDKAASSAFSLKGALAAIGGVALFGKGKEMLIDFNSQVDQMKIGMTAVMQMQLHMPFKKASEEADKLFKTFQELAKKSPATTKDFMEMANQLAPAVAMAGGGPGKLAKLTQGGVLASLAFGEKSEVVGLDIKQMLAGTVGNKDRIATQLLASKGIDYHDFNNTDKYSAQDRAKTTESLLGDNQALKDAADRMGESFAGQVSTFQDQLQITLGTVGLPLMQKITAEVKKWNDWIEKHPKTIKEWATTFSNGLSKGFEFLKNVASFFVDNREILFGLAKTLVMFKGAQMGANAFGAFTKGVGGMADNIKNFMSRFNNIGTEGVSGAFGGLTSMANGLASKVIPALGLFTGAIELATYWLDNNRESDKKAREAKIDINEATGDWPELLARRNKLKGTKGGDSIRNATELANLEKQLYSPETLGLALRKLSEASEKHGGRSAKDLSREDIVDSSFSRLLLPNLYDSKATAEQNAETYKNSSLILEQISKIAPLENGMALDRILKYAFPEQYGMPTPTDTPSPGESWGGGPSDKKIEVNIQKVEVASEDPDRFVFGLVKIADNAIKHSTQSQHATPGGF